jgi:hypothetical protein
VTLVRPHPYLRAYMAGITLPCFLLLFVMVAFTVARHVYDVAIPLERVIVFPMAVVPNAWGLWNVLYVACDGRWRLSPGAHGAVLPFLLAPIAYTVTRLVGFEAPEHLAQALPLVFPVVVAVFYLIWKHVVGFLNEVLGIA